MHPDQHALVFDPGNPDRVFIGSDGGVVRTDGTYVDGNPGNAVCGARDFTHAADPAADLAFCQLVLARIPHQIDSLNTGLNTLQFQSLSVNTAQPYADLQGGTQDNGTWQWDGGANWFEGVGGDGGQSTISRRCRPHAHVLRAERRRELPPGGPLQWAYNTGPMDAADVAAGGNEAFSFYVPLIGDPVVAGTTFVGGQYVWRTKDDGGSQAYLEANCLEGDFKVPPAACGDFQRVGPQVTADPANYIAALSRAPSDTGTLWIGLRRGGLLLSGNADAAPADVTYTPITAPGLPGRFVSSIAVDPADPYHAFVSNSGYGAYTPGQPGHVFEVRFAPASGTATVTDRSYDLGDQPVTGLVLDGPTGDLYAATDFGVARLPAGATAWADAAPALPFAAVYGLTIAPRARVLYAATHGRGAYRLPLDPTARISGPATGTVGTSPSPVPTHFGYRATEVLDVPGRHHLRGRHASTRQPRATEQTLAVTDQLGHTTTTTRMAVAVTRRPRHRHRRHRRRRHPGAPAGSPRPPLAPSLVNVTFTVKNDPRPRTGARRGLQGARRDELPPDGAGAAAREGEDQAAQAHHEEDPLAGHGGRLAGQPQGLAVRHAAPLTPCRKI